MGKIHEFISKHIRILKWIPWVNWYLQLYYMIRVTFITRKMPKFSWVAKAIGLVVGVVIVVSAACYYVLPLIFTKQTAGQLLDYLMPIVVTFVIVPTFIGLEVKTDTRE